MQARMNYAKAAPDVLQAMRALEAAVRACGLDPILLELVKIRASQINGCAYCLQIHAKDARSIGESEERLHELAAWHESPRFTARERAALGWTEALTRVAETHAPDADYEEARRHFGEEEMAKLTLAIVAINGWNRFAVGFRLVHRIAPPAE